MKSLAVVVSVVALTSGGANAGEPNAETPVSVAISDPGLGLEIKATSVVRNVDAVPVLDAYAGDEETIAVKIEATLGDQYSDSFGGNSLRILNNDGTEEFQTLNNRFPGRQAQIAEAQNGAGRPSMGSITRGQSGSGWVYFNIEPKGAESLTLRYSRQPTTVISGNGSTKIPAKDFDVVLQAPAAE